MSNESLHDLYEQVRRRKQARETRAKWLVIVALPLILAAVLHYVW